MYTRQRTETSIRQPLFRACFFLTEYRSEVSPPHTAPYRSKPETATKNANQGGRGGGLLRVRGKINRGREYLYFVVPLC